MLLPVSAHWFSGIGSGGFTAFAPRRHARGMLRRQKRRDPAEPDAGAIRYTGGHSDRPQIQEGNDLHPEHISLGVLFSSLLKNASFQFLTACC